MEISNYYVPVALILPIVAILGILFVSLAMSYVLRRRRDRDTGAVERDGNDRPGSS